MHFQQKIGKDQKKKLNYLFNLLENFLINRIEDLNKQKIKLKIIGIKNFSKKLNKLLKNSEKKKQKKIKITN